MHFRTLAALLLALATGPLAAQDFAWSGYGTIGYAASNREFRYQRFIDRDGSFDADSVFGAQADLRFTPQWSATAQLKLAPSLKSDSRWDLQPAWAFVAWRPADDWLLRAGRLRVPLYLHSESMDVGVTHDMARLPAEMYSIIPSTDFNGLAAARTWALADSELSADVYSGRIGTTARLWYRDGVPPQQAAGANFVDVSVRSSGAVLTLRSSDALWRGGVHHTVTRRRNGETIAVRYPFVPVAPGIGYYQVADAMPGPGIESVDAITNIVYTVGFDQTLGAGWRVAAEFARNRQRDTELGSDTRGGYVAVLRQIGHATPYVSWGRLRASDGALDWYHRLIETQLPALVPGADQVNAAQRVAAESIYAVDQRSLAFGASYAIDAGQKVKLEWMRTRIGRVSRLIDTPAGTSTPHDTHLDVWSVNYNFSF